MMGTYLIRQNGRCGFLWDCFESNGQTISAGGKGSRNGRQDSMANVHDIFMGLDRHHKLQQAVLYSTPVVYAPQMKTERHNGIMMGHDDDHDGDDGGNEERVRCKGDSLPCWLRASIRSRRSLPNGAGSFRADE